MESYLNENFDLTSKNPTDEALRRWRKLSGVVKKPKRRFRYTANLLKGMEAQAMRRTNQRSFRIAEYMSKAALNFLWSTGNVSTEEEGDEEGGGEKKDEGGGDEGGGGKGGGGCSEKKDKPDDSEKKDKDGGGRAGEKKDKTSGELRRMGANKVYGGWFTFGPGTCTEAVVDEPKLAADWVRIHSVRMPFNIAAGVGTVTIHLCEWANRFSPSLVVVWF